MFSVISLLLVFSVFIFLQIYICKNFKNKKIGLILPVGSFLLSIFPLISIILIMIISLLPNRDISAILVSTNTMFIPTILYQILITIFLIIIIFTPSIIFTLIYFYYKNKKNEE